MKLIIFILIFPFLISCSNTKYNEHEISIDSELSENALIQSPLPKINYIENQQTNTGTPIGKYESFLLNSYADLETKVAFQDFVYASQDPILSMQNDQVYQLEKEVKDYSDFSKQYQRPQYDEIENIQKKYQKHLELNEGQYGKRVIFTEAIDHLGTAASVGIGASGVGIPVAISVEVGKNFLVNRLEAANEEFIKEIRKQAVGSMVQQIDQLSDFDRQSFEAIDLSNPELAYQDALKLTKKISSNLMPEGLDLEAKASVQASVSEYLAKSAISLLAEHKSIQGIKDSMQDQVIEQNSENLVKLATGLVQFQKQTGERIGVLFENQKEILNFVNEQNHEIRSEMYVLKDGLQKIEKKNQFITDYLYSKMSTGEQIQALQNGVYGDPSSEEVQDLLKNKEKILKKEEFQNQFNKFINYASDISTIAQNIGLDPKISQTIVQGIDKAQKIHSAMNALANQNYIGAVAALTGIFGKGGIDPAAERHAQMMKMLQQMDMKLDKIINLQQKTMEMIVQVSKQIQDSTILLSKQNYENKYILLGINETLQEILNKDFSSCISIKKDIEEDFNNRVGLYFLKLTHSNLRNLEFCSDLMDSRFYANNTSAHFHFSTYMTSQNTAQAQFSEKQMMGLLNILNSKKDHPKFNKSMLDLLNPSMSFLHLYEKSNQMEEQNLGYQFSFYERKMSPAAVLEQIRYLVDLLTPISIYQNLGTNLDVLSAADSRLGKKQYVLLQNALVWLNRAIAQETLLSGDSLIPLIANDLKVMKPVEKCEIESLNQVYCALNLNDALRKNVVHFLIYEDLRKQNKNYISYSTAINSSHSSSQFSSIAKLLIQPWKYVANAQGYVSGVELAGHIVPLPTVNQLREGKFDVSPILSELLFVRERILVKMTEMQMNSNLTESERRYFTYKVLPQL